jgi:ABC-type branched-subunit amino acid transport system ATPase component
VSPAPLLEVRGLSRWFGGLAAVEDVDLRVERGQIAGLIGPNGAGKTTAFNMISGALPPTSGTIAFDGARIDGRPPEAIARRGLVRTFQNLRLFLRLSVLDNVTVGTFCQGPASLVSWAMPGHQRWLEARRREAAALLAFTGLGDLADQTAMHLSHAQQRRLEVARALATKPRLLLLDEPCAGLTRAEVESLVDLIRGVRDQGVTVLLIEHDMDFVMALADFIVVLNFGRKIAEGVPAEIRANPEVIAAYLGTEELGAQA